MRRLTLSEVLRSFLDMQTDMKALIVQLKILNNHLSTMEKTVKSIDKFAKEIRVSNEQMSKLIAVFSELSPE